MYSRWCICRANLKVGLIPRVNLWNCTFFSKANIYLLSQSCDSVCGCDSSLLVRQMLNIVLALLFPSILLNVAFELVLDALYMNAKGGGMEVRQREHRWSVLIMHTCPLTDRSQHGALWASAPAYREEKWEKQWWYGRRWRWKKKLLPARYLIWGRFWWWNQRDLIVPKTALSVCLCLHEHVKCFYAGKKSWFYYFFCLRLNWMSSVADRPLTAEPI